MYLLCHSCMKVHVHVVLHNYEYMYMYVLVKGVLYSLIAVDDYIKHTHLLTLTCTCTHSLHPPLPTYTPSNLFSASIDKTAAVWDCKTGTRVKKLKGHTSFVNSCCPSRRGTQYLATGSDDGTIKVRMDVVLE